MNPLRKIPPGARLYVYLVFSMVSLVLTYLSAKHVIGADEITLWSGFGALFGFTAASNVYKRRR